MRGLVDTPPRRQKWHIITAIPFLLALNALLVLYMMGESTLSSTPARASEQSWHFKYSTVTGYFQQDEPDTDPVTFDFKKHNFGLIDRSYSSNSTLSQASNPTLWQRFSNHLYHLNADSSSSTTYRLLFLGRHGQGWHNVAESYYGTEAWNCYYSTLDGTPNGSMTWADAQLTKLGIKQATEVHKFWTKQIEMEKMPTPQSYYVSPLDRAIETAEITFRKLKLASDRKYDPLIKELVREGNGIHTCDRRSKKSEIQEQWPEYAIEKGFTEDDELWRPDLRESATALAARLQSALDDIFDSDSNTWISITAHSGTIAAILKVVGHQVFGLPTGAVIPVFVRVEKVKGRRPEMKIDPWEPKPDCEGDISQAGRTKGESVDVYWENLQKMG